MNKYITLKNILDSGVVAVIRAENKDEALEKAIDADYELCDLQNFEYEID